MTTVGRIAKVLSMARRIRKANIQFISLVPAGANKIQPVYKDDGSVEIGTVSKMSEEQGELTAVVYAPEMRDSQGDIASAEVVKQMAHDFIANGAKVDIRHDGKALKPEQARVGETFLVQKSDTRFHGWKDRDNNALNLEGAWATIIKIDDPELRKKYRSGEWAGVSMGGTAIVEPEDTVGKLEKLLEKVLKALPTPKPEPETMDETKLLKAITDGISALGEQLTKALTPKPPETPKPEDKKVEKVEKVEKDPNAPVFKGNAEDPRAVEKHARAVELYALRKGADFNDPAGVREYNLAVQTLKAEWAAADKESGLEDEEQTKKAGPAGGGEKKPQLFVDASKSVEDQAAAGAVAAAAFMKSRSRATAAQ